MRAEITTDEALLARLRRAALMPIDRRQLHTQKVSFIYGNLPHDSTVTRAEIETALDTIEGTPERV